MKPPEVWEFLARHITVPGQLILEPCAGVGSGTLAMLKMGLRVHSCEIDEKHYNNLVLNVRDFFKTTNSNCTFS